MGNGMRTMISISWNVGYFKESYKKNSRCRYFVENGNDNILCVNYI